MRAASRDLAPSAYYPHVGGIEELTRQLALALGARGHAVAVLTNRWPEGVQTSEVLDGIDVTRLRFPLPAAEPFRAARFLATSPAAAFALVRHLHRWRPHIVHVIGAGPQSVYLGTLRPHFAARLIFTGQGELTFDANGIFHRSVISRAGLRRIMRGAHAVTACSAYVLRDLEAFCDVRGSTYVIPNGVDPAAFADTEQDQNEFGRYILAVGRIVPQKAFDVLLDALCSELLAGMNLVIAGDGFERPRLERRAAELNIASRVRFLGSVDRARLPRLMRGACVFAFPSRGEPFGIALLEAMAAGLPAVATASGGIPEFARDGENALLVPPDNPQAFAVALARLATDAELRQRLAAGGRKTARELDWTHLVTRYEGVYRDALQAGPT